MVVPGIFRCELFFLISCRRFRSSMLNGLAENDDSAALPWANAANLPPIFLPLGGLGTCRNPPVVAPLLYMGLVWYIGLLDVPLKTMPVGEKKDGRDGN